MHRPDASGQREGEGRILPLWGHHNHKDIVAKRPEILAPGWSMFVLFYSIAARDV